MDSLKNRIREEGIYLGDGILKVDSLINHQVDAAIMWAAGEEFARRFEHLPVTRILTAEVSGLIPAVMTAHFMQVPLVFARKHKPITMQEPTFLQRVPSHTKGRIVSLQVAAEFLHPADQVLIIDDFLASGKTIDALGRLVQEAGAKLVGIGTLVEKGFESGRTRLAHWDVPIESLVIISELKDDGTIVFAE